MTSQNFEQQNTIEIDLVALLKKLLIQWRAIIIFSLIIGLVAGGLKYAKDTASYRSALALSQTDTSSDDIIASSGLTVDEQDAVQQAVAQKKQIEDQTDYQTNSLYMNLDPGNLRQLSILYFIRADNGVDAADLLAVYNEMLKTDESVNKIMKASGLETKPQYIRELISSYDAKSSDRGSFTKDSSTDVMRITFYLPDGADSTAIDKAIEKLIKDYDIKSLGVPNGSIRKISSDINTITDRDIQADQTSYTSSLNNLKSSYKTATDAFTDDQKTLFEKLLRENGLYDQTTSTRLKEASEKQKEAASSSSSSSSFSKEEEQTPAPVAPSFSGKYFAIGFIVGILLYVFCMVIIEILSSRCSSIATYESGSILGSLLDITNHKSSFLFCDRFLMKLLYRKQSDLDSGIDRILTRAQMNSSTDKLSNVELWTVGFDGSGISSVSKLISDAASKGITMTLRSTPDTKPDDMLPDITPGKSMILAIQDGRSHKKDASFLTEMLFTRKADYLGMVELM